MHRCPLQRAQNDLVFENSSEKTVKINRKECAGRQAKESQEKSRSGKGSSRMMTDGTMLCEQTCLFPKHTTPKQSRLELSLPRGPHPVISSQSPPFKDKAIECGKNGLEEIKMHPTPSQMETLQSQGQRIFLAWMAFTTLNLANWQAF